MTAWKRNSEKTKMSVWERLKSRKGGKCKKREIKMDKEIMSNEKRQPEEPTWVSDVVAQRQHLRQLWNAQTQLICPVQQQKIHRQTSKKLKCHIDMWLIRLQSFGLIGQVRFIQQHSRNIRKDRSSVWKKKYTHSTGKKCKWVFNFYIYSGTMSMNTGECLPLQLQEVLKV